MAADWRADGVWSWSLTHSMAVTPRFSERRAAPLNRRGRERREEPGLPCLTLAVPCRVVCLAPPRVNSAQVDIPRLNPARQLFARLSRPPGRTITIAIVSIDASRPPGPGSMLRH